jgi:phosphatidylserine/phosphatidylglycerophosphate/cardiolipin synthase-like enzyme
VAGRLKRKAILLLFLLAGVPLGLAHQAGGQEPTGTAKLRPLVDSDYYPALLAGIQAAGVSIDLTMYLWKQTKSSRNKPEQLIGALGQAVRRGVRVRVVLENSGYDQDINRFNRETAQLLEREGIKVFFDSPAITTHAKVAIIDGRYTYLGSHNLTQSALGQNHELSILADDPELAVGLTAYIDKLTAP